MSTALEVRNTIPTRMTHPQQARSAQKLLDSALRTGELPLQSFSGKIMNQLRNEGVIRRHSVSYSWIVDKPWRLKEIITEAGGIDFTTRRN